MNPDDTPDEDRSVELDQLQPADTLADPDVDDVLDRGYSAPENWSPGEGFGTTADEALEGESFEQRLAQEEPEPDPDAPQAEWLDDGEVGDVRAGRLVDPDRGVGEDVDAELVGDDVGIDGAAASAEEAAVHVVED